MKVGSNIHRKETIIPPCSGLITALDRTDATYFYHDPKSAFASHAFQYDLQGFPYDPQGFQCDATFHQPIPMDSYFEDADAIDCVYSEYDMLTGGEGLRRTDQNLSTALFDHYSVPSYLEHDPLGIMNLSGCARGHYTPPLISCTTEIDHDEQRSPSSHPPLLCDRSFGRSLIENSPSVSNGASSSGTISKISDDRRHPSTSHHYHHHQQQPPLPPPPSQPHQMSQQHKNVIHSSTNVASPSSISAKNSHLANFILKEVCHVGVAGGDADTSPPGYSFYCRTNNNTSSSSYGGIAGCRKRKSHGRCKETDENMTAKRQKHNAMEKVRRRVVADGFEALARVLRIKTGRKPSKATILIKAKESIHVLNSRTAQVQREIYDISEKRIALTRKLDSFKKM